MTCRTQCYFVGSLHVYNYRVLLFTLSLSPTFNTHSLLEPDRRRLPPRLYCGYFLIVLLLWPWSQPQLFRSQLLLLLVAPSLPQMSRTIAPTTTPPVGGHLVGKEGQTRSWVSSRGGRDRAWGGWWWNGAGPARGRARRERTDGQGGGASKVGTHGGCAQ
jgi:hypothetical protein